MQETTFTVSQLNQLTKAVLEQSFPNIIVEGEISNFSMPRSGHWYFSLKDEKAQVRCAMFKGRNSRTTFFPEDGMQVQVKAAVTLYENRGDFQLIVEEIQAQGDGALRRAFEQLKNQLAKAGLFDEIHKKSLPRFVHRLGVITSATGAALQDILTTLNRRYPLMHITIYASLVQGKTAAASIVKAIKRANQDNTVQVLLLARGGGSLEDLWPFNEESVAHAIFDSHLPVITGIGHEVDITIADLVADVRAATPTAAAEQVSVDQAELTLLVQTQMQRISTRMQQFIQRKQEQVNWAKKHLLSLHPKQAIQTKMQQLDFLQIRLTDLTQGKLQALKNQFRGLSRSLDALSPLKTLARGYTITFRQKTAITQASTVKIGEELTTKLADGEIISIVEKIQ